MTIRDLATDALFKPPDPTCHHWSMFGDESQDENFEDTLRSIAGELGRFIERSFDSADVDEAADAFGIDPAAARDWVESAGSWLRAQAQNLGDELANRVGAAGQKGGQARTPGQAGERMDPLGSIAPHPLDLPTDEQGLALSALDSGRWTVEPGTDALTAKGDGPGPSNAIGIVRELRVRDWIGPDGELTLVGRHALSRWLDAAGHG